MRGVGQVPVPDVDAERSSQRRHGSPERPVFREEEERTAIKDPHVDRLDLVGGERRTMAAALPRRERRSSPEALACTRLNSADGHASSQPAAAWPGPACGHARRTGDAIQCAGTAAVRSITQMSLVCPRVVPK
jgi:hypothetical protein